ncbi:glutaredoxin [bacterium]|jgi:glutaredoxin|nr:glutaredoxin [bacterium]
MLLKLIRFSLGNLIIFLNWIIPPLKQKRTKEDQTINDQKTKFITLYQFHLCPFCVRVRRNIKRLNLTIKYKDAKRNTVHRDELKEGGGKVKVPCLKIETNDEITWLYESKMIINYLNTQFDNSNLIH